MLEILKKLKAHWEAEAVAMRYYKVQQPSELFGYMMAASPYYDKTWGGVAHEQAVEDSRIVAREAVKFLLGD